MRSVFVRLACAAAAAAALAMTAAAQDKQAMPASTDPRVGLKPGFKDAGQVARHMELIATLPKPQGFFDPQNPAGPPSPPERQPGERGAAPEGAAAGATPPAAEAAAPPPGAAPPGGAAQAQPGGRGRGPAPGTAAAGLNFANSDLAFSRNHVFMGNFNGFNTYDVDSTKRPKLLASVVCPGGQGDMSIHGNLLFMSVEQTRGRIDCGTQGVQETVSKERFRGVRIFDISDIRSPKQIAAIQTCRGSHTHTLVRDLKDPANIYIYGSGTGAVRAGEELEGCSGKDPKEDPNTALFSIDVIKVPLAEPAKAAIVNRPRIFADEKGNLAGLWQGGNHGEGTQSSRLTNQCHDITVFPEVGLAAGACSGNGILLDISDPVNPKRLDAVTDKAFAYWHSATFNNDGTKIVFTDEWGGGTRPRCRATDPPTWGGDAVFDIVDRRLKFGGYYKLPAPQTEQENCVAHNGSIVPVPGRDIMVQGWYQGGVSVFDFTDSTRPYEIAYFDRGPIDAKNLVTGGYWSAYWYNGHIYGSEIARGIDIFTLKPSEHLSQNEIEAAALVRFTEVNVQEQRKATWPNVPVVARAYLDQLTRTSGITAARASAVKAALSAADKLRPRDRNDAVRAQLDSVAAQVEADAAAASGRDAMRLRALAATLKGIGRG